MDGFTAKFHENRMEVTIYQFMGEVPFTMENVYCMICALIPSLPSFVYFFVKLFVPDQSLLEIFIRLTNHPLLVCRLWVIPEGSV